MRFGQRFAHRSHPDSSQDLLVEGVTVYVDVEAQAAMLGRAGLLLSNLTRLDALGSPEARPDVAAMAAAQGVSAADLRRWAAWAAEVGAGIPTFPINTGAGDAVRYEKAHQPSSLNSCFPSTDGIDIGGTSIIVRNVVSNPAVQLPPWKKVDCPMHPPPDHYELRRRRRHQADERQRDALLVLAGHPRRQCAHSPGRRTDDRLRPAGQRRKLRPQRHLPEQRQHEAHQGVRERKCATQWYGAAHLRSDPRLYVKTDPCFFDETGPEGSVGDACGTGVIDSVSYVNITMTRPLWWGIYAGPQQQSQPANGCVARRAS